MNITYDDNFIYVVGAQASIRDYLVARMGASYSKAKDHCRLYKNTHIMNELWLKVPDLRSVPGFMELGYELKRSKEMLLTTRTEIASLEPVSELLRPYQNEDVNLLKEFEVFGVFNEPRTGKTPTVLAGVMQAGVSTALIVVPASLMWNWFYEIEKWVIDAHAEVIDASAKFEKKYAAFNNSKAKHRFLIMSKNMLPNLVHNIEQVNFGAIIVDEAHFLRNHATRQSKAIYRLKGKRRYVLTGTPTVKHPSDIYGILKFLYPKKYNAHQAFLDRYFRKDFNPFSDSGKKVGGIIPEREQELQEEIGFISTSRKRSEAMAWLPEKEYEFIKTPMTPAQDKAYQDMKEMFYHEDQGDSVDAMNVISQLGRLRQIAIDQRTVGLKTIGAKTNLLKQWLQDNDKPASVIMSMFTGYLEILEKDLTAAGYKVAMLTGQQTLAEKKANAEAFQRGEIDLLLCNTITAGTGWTLDRSDTVIFMDNAWNPADQQQAEDRVTPTTPERLHRHRVIVLMTAGTVDEWMFELLKTKKSLTDVLNEGGQKVLRNMLW